jgi:hypothetical protein
VHLGGHDLAGKDTSSDRHHAGEGALLVNVRALDRGPGRAEAQTNVLVPSPATGVLAGASDLVVLEDVRLPSVLVLRTASMSRRKSIAYLLLESAFRLDTEFQLAGRQ